MLPLKTDLSREPAEIIAEAPRHCNEHHFILSAKSHTYQNVVHLLKRVTFVAVNDMNITETPGKSTQSNGKKFHGVSVLTYLSGLTGLSLAVTCGTWVFLSLATPGVMPPLLSRRSSLVMFVGVFILALICGVCAWISGVIASRRAQELGRHGYRRWRLGLYMGIFTVTLLMIIFVILVSYSIHILMYRGQHGFDARML